MLDRRLIEAGLERRRLVHARLRALAFARVWDQVDRAPPMTELEQASFLSRRLFPELEGPRLDAIMERLAAEWEAGTWTGFVRPKPIRSDATAPGHPVETDESPGRSVQHGRG